MFQFEAFDAQVAHVALFLFLPGIGLGVLGTKWFLEAEKCELLPYEHFHGNCVRISILYIVATYFIFVYGGCMNMHLCQAWVLFCWVKNPKVDNAGARGNAHVASL